MHVLIADRLPPIATEVLADAHIKVTEDPSLKDEALANAVVTTGADVLVVRSTHVNAEALGAGRLGLVVRAGAGVNTIDIEAASAAGIYVSNCPGRNSLAVAELAIGMLVALDRRIPDAVAELRAGRWRKREFSKARGLAGRTLGVVGAGRIGLAVAQRAIGLGMQVLAWDIAPHTRPQVEEIGARFVPELDAMVARCDAVSLHLPATDETRHIINETLLARMKDGAFLINTARAGLIDEAALLRALDAKGMRAGVDVFDDEVSGGEGDVSSALLNHPGVIATPHIGASTAQAQEAVAAEAVRIVLEFQRTGRAPNVVNVHHAAAATHLLVVRHLNQVGVLSEVFSALKHAEINVLETENIVFDGGRACVARIEVDQAPTPDLLGRIGDHVSVLGTDLVALESR